MGQTSAHDRYNLIILDLLPDNVTSVVEVGCMLGRFRVPEIREAKTRALFDSAGTQVPRRNLVGRPEVIYRRAAINGVRFRRFPDCR